MGACHRFAGGFAGAQPRLAKIAQYIAIFRLIAVAPYLNLLSVRRGRVPQTPEIVFVFPVPWIKSVPQFPKINLVPLLPKMELGIQPPGMILVFTDVGASRANTYVGQKNSAPRSGS